MRTGPDAFHSRSAGRARARDRAASRRAHSSDPRSRGDAMGTDRVESAVSMKAGFDPGCSDALEPPAPRYRTETLTISSALIGATCIRTKTREPAPRGVPECESVR